MPLSPQREAYSVLDPDDCWPNNRNKKITDFRSADSDRLTFFIPLGFRSTAENAQHRVRERGRAIWRYRACVHYRLLIRPNRQPDSLAQRIPELTKDTRDFHQTLQFCSLGRKSEADKPNPVGSLSEA